jgi:hypothetical protein
MNARTNWAWIALVLLPVVSGCGGPLVKVTGRLTYKGQPVPSTLVTFFPDNGSRRSTGLTDDNGHFTLRYSRTEWGVSRGQHAVFVRYDVSAEEETGQIKPKASKELKAIIAKYGDPKTSGLHYEITQDGQYVEVELK